MDWLKKKRACSTEDRRALVDGGHASISLRRQCELLGVNRASLSYQALGESQENLPYMRWIDEQYRKTPFFASRRMTAWLQQEKRVDINRKRVRRLLQVRGLEAVYPKPKLSRPGEGHRIYPYRLQGVSIERVNQVWSTAITYLRLAQGFCYLVAVRDWHSRFVLSWSLSLTMEVEFCLEALASALGRAPPERCNSDQGAPFTRERFTGELERGGISISRDGRGRCFDNIFIERLGRSLKHEEVYLNEYERVSEARSGLERWLEFYHHRRPPQSLGYRTPAAVYPEGQRATASAVARIGGTRPVRDKLIPSEKWS